VCEAAAEAVCNRLQMEREMSDRAGRTGPPWRLRLAQHS
jgi:hypothetical protein